MANDDLPTLATDVLVVGAGPTGLLAGLVLARRGVPAIVVDAKAGPTRESRALAVQARTMEIFDQLGLVQEVLAGSYVATRFQLRPDADPGGFSFEAAQRGDTRYPGMHIFEQSRTEQLLSSTLTSAGGEIRWGHRLVDLVEASDGGVVALVEGPDGLLRVRARWCVGADGATSRVRRLLDVPFEGVTDDATFWVADLHGVSGVPDRAVSGRFGDVTFAVVFPLGPGGHVRLISMAAGDAVDQETALATARSDLGLRYTGVAWFSTYRVHHRVAARFRKGSTFLAGDAAHVHSPIGGQGMNTGLQDAHDLALLLADVAQGHLTAAALDRYERERRPVALRLVKATDRVFGFVARRGRGPAWWRRRISRVIAFLAPRVLVGASGARLAGWLGQYRIRYPVVRDGVPLPVWADAAVVGLRLPPVGDDDPLRTLTWQLHTYGTHAVRPAVPDWVEGPVDHGVDPEGRLRSDRLYLVRPDGFVVASVPLRDGVAEEPVVRAALAAQEVAGTGVPGS